MKSVSLQVADTRYCRNTLNKRYEENGAFGEDLFCADDTAGSTSGTCHGDSGGPMVALKASELRFVLKGIVQGGEACGAYNSPDVFTSTNFGPIYNWIVRKVNACSNGHLECTNGEDLLKLFIHYETVDIIKKNLFFWYLILIHKYPKLIMQ